MSCCGQARQTVSSAVSRPAGGKARRGVPPLVYTGATSMTVLGPRTGRVYRFTTTGARLEVDPRDWSALTRVPSLQAG